MPKQENPSELKGALYFGLLYALIIFAVAAGKEHFGNQSLYVIAGLSGLTDVDVITLYNITVGEYWKAKRKRRMEANFNCNNVKLIFQSCDG